MIYSIHEDNVPQLMKSLAKVERKCSKYGCSFTCKQVGEEFKTFTTDQYGVYYPEPQVRKFYLYEIEGLAKINGWEFLATIQHLNGGNLIHSAKPDTFIDPIYRTRKPVCDHCNSNRNRKDTYLVRNGLGEVKQVGKSCLKAFTGGFSAESIASFLAFFEELATFEHHEGSSLTKYIPKLDYLYHVAECVKRYGFFKSQAPDNYDGGGWYSTTTRAYNYMFPTKDEKIQMKAEGYVSNTIKNQKLVEDALEWVKAQDPDNDYLYSLQLVCQQEYLLGRNLGLIASLLPAYQRSLEQVKKEKATSKSSYQGSIGERLTLIADIHLMTTWETDFGMTYLYTLSDVYGNVFIWKASAHHKDGRIAFKGTVKDHNEYKGIKQTILTRCKITAYLEETKWELVDTVG